MSDRRVRRATHDDYDAVVAFTQDTWAERETGDYIPRVFHDWVSEDGPDQRTVVVEVEVDDGWDVAGVCQGTLLSEHEAWLQGMRVDPEHRGGGHGLAMVADLFEWGRDAGVTVARNMVFGWNDAGLGQSMAAGFEPRTSFRWATPKPRADERGERVTNTRVTDDPAAAWSYWTRSHARDVLGGLALDANETWAVSELTRKNLHRLADEERVFAITDDGTRGMAARVRTTEQTTDGDGTERVVEYGVGAWEDADAADVLFATIRADAADLGADATRVLIPESPRHVPEAAATRSGVSDYSDFVLEADLTRGE